MPDRHDPAHAAAVIDDGLRGAADRFVGDLLDLPATDRDDRLDRLRASDPALHAIVASLVAHLGALDDFLERPHAASAGGEPGDAFVGRSFGHWTVVRPVGRGGMGLVFEVVRNDGVVEQRAALKLLDRSTGDPAIVRRFAIERQILAGLEHPHIARLIDGGATDDGRPYLVMEYIDGAPLDAWCESRGCTLDQRLALFETVCTAVHYAHQRLVVHRDLKPSNILVTADGTPKLLDFGVSKLVRPEGEAAAETIDASTLLTPRYASPEQLTGAPISTASDVYSLGVVLFELLTGEAPYRTHHDSLVEMMRAVLTGDPTRASTAAGRSDAAPIVRSRLVRRLRGDLDQILAKALARQPAERYDSAAALRDDLVRHRAGDPIKAVAPTWTYRAGKFVRKHRAAVSVATVVTVALVSLGIIATFEAYRADRERALAERQRAIAEQRFEDTRNLARAMMFDLNDAIATGPTKAREQLVRTALTYLDRLSQERLSPDLQRDVAGGYERIAQILGDGNGNNLGRTGEAKQYLLKALSIREQLAQADHGNVDDLAGLVTVNRSLGAVTRFAGSPDEAAGYFAAATRFAIARSALRPDDVGAALDVFGRRRDEALIRFVPGRPSLKQYGEAMRRYRELLADIDGFAATHDPKLVSSSLQTVLNDITRLARLGGDARSALESSQRDLALAEQEAREQPDNPEKMRGLALSLRATGDSLMELGREDEGLALLRRSRDLRAELHARDPSSVLAARDMAIGYAMMGYAHDLSGRPAEALPEYTSWARAAEEALRKDPGNKGHRLDLAQARWSIADMQMALGRPGVARAEARRVEADIVAFAGPAPTDEAAREALGKARVIAARAMVATQASDDAFGLATLGIESLQVNTERTPEDAFAARDVARARIEAGIVGLASAVHRDEGCRLIARGRDDLVVLQQRQRLTVQFRPVLATAAQALVRCPHAK